MVSEPRRAAQSRPERTRTIDFATPAIGASAAVLRALKSCDPAVYPDAGSSDLKSLLAAAVGCPDAALTVVSGTTELMHMAARLVGAGTLAFIAGPADPEVERACRVAGLITAAPPLDASLGWDIAAACSRIEQLRPGLVWLSTPNRVSGEALDRHSVEAIIAAANAGVVVVDDSLGGFADAQLDSAKLARRGNVVVVRSLAPTHGIGGLRIGYAISVPQLAGALEAHQPRRSVNIAAQQAALVALADAAGSRAWDRVRRRRAEMVRCLEASGVRALPSQADFVWIEVGDASLFTRRIATLGMRVIDGTPHGLPRYVRIAVRARADVLALTDAMGRL